MKKRDYYFENYVGSPTPFIKLENLTAHLEREKIYAKGQDYKDLNNKYNNSIVGFNSDESIVYLINSYDGKKDLKKGISYLIF